MAFFLYVPEQAVAGAIGGGTHVAPPLVAAAAAVAATTAAAAAATARWAIPAGITPGMVALNMGLVVWSGLFVSSSTTFLQTIGQRVVPAADAALIYATQPLWASLWAAALLGESFGGRGVLGGLLILGGVVGAGRRHGRSAARQGTEEGGVAPAPSSPPVAP